MLSCLYLVVMFGICDGDLNVVICIVLGKVIDFELWCFIIELGMVKSIDIGLDGSVYVEIYLIIVGCLKKFEIIECVIWVVVDVLGILVVWVSLDVMSDE